MVADAQPQPRTESARYRNVILVSRAALIQIKALAGKPIGNVGCSPVMAKFGKYVPGGPDRVQPFMR